MSDTIATTLSSVISLRTAVIAVVALTPSSTTVSWTGCPSTPPCAFVQDAQALMTSPIRLVLEPSGPLKLPIEPIAMGLPVAAAPDEPDEAGEPDELVDPPELHAGSAQMAAAEATASNLVTDGFVTERCMRTPLTEGQIRD